MRVVNILITGMIPNMFKETNHTLIENIPSHLQHVIRHNNNSKLTEHNDYQNKICPLHESNTLRGLNIQKITKYTSLKNNKRKKNNQSLYLSWVFAGTLILMATRVLIYQKSKSKPIINPTTKHQKNKNFESLNHTLDQTITFIETIEILSSSQNIKKTTYLLYKIIDEISSLSVNTDSIIKRMQNLIRALYLRSIKINGDNEFLNVCPLTLNIPKEPILDKFGFHFEKSEFNTFLNYKSSKILTHPITRTEICKDVKPDVIYQELTRMILLKRIIQKRICIDAFSQLKNK